MVNFIKNQNYVGISGRTGGAKTLDTEALQSIVKAVDKMNGVF